MDNTTHYHQRQQCNWIPYQQRQQRQQHNIGADQIRNHPNTIQTIVQQDQPKTPKSRNYSGIPHVQSDQQLDELSEICHHKFVEETNGAEGNIDGENRKIYNILVQITNRPDKNFSFAVNNQMSSVWIRTHSVLNCISISNGIRYHNPKNCIFINTSQAPIKFSVPSIFITNECHITNKVVQLCGVVAINSPSLVLITESWLDSTIPDSAVAIGNSYKTYSLERPTPGGSVLDYVNTNIPTTRLYDLEAKMVAKGSYMAAA